MCRWWCRPQVGMGWCVAGWHAAAARKGPQAAAGWGCWGVLHVPIAARHVLWQQYAANACATFPDQGRFAKAPDTWSMQVVAPCVWWCCCWMHSPSCRWSCCPCRRLPLRPCARIQLRHDALPALAGHTLRRLNPACAHVAALACLSLGDARTQLACGWLCPGTCRTGRMPKSSRQIGQPLCRTAGAGPARNGSSLQCQHVPGVQLVRISGRLPKLERRHGLRGTAVSNDMPQQPT